HPLHIMLPDVICRRTQLVGSRVGEAGDRFPTWQAVSLPMKSRGCGFQATGCSGAILLNLVRSRSTQIRNFVLHVGSYFGYLVGNTLRIGCGLLKRGALRSHFLVSCSTSQHVGCHLTSCPLYASDLNFRVVDWFQCLRCIAAGRSRMPIWLEDP